MFSFSKILFSILLILSLSSCGGSVEIEGSIEGSVEYSSVTELRQFDMIDSYGLNSEFFPVAVLALSPYLNNGEFDLFWTVFSDEGYYIDVRINNIPSLAGSQLVFSEYCDPYLPCHSNQVLFCGYQANFDVRCSTPFGNTQVANVGYLLSYLPQTLYFIVDICDGSGDFCEYQAIPALME